MGAVITIPKELVKKKELVLIPRRKYEELLRMRETKLNLSEKRAIKEAREELRKGKYLTLKQFQHELGG